MRTYRRNGYEISESVNTRVMPTIFGFSSRLKMTPFTKKWNTERMAGLRQEEISAQKHIS